MLRPEPSVRTLHPSKEPSLAIQRIAELSFPFLLFLVALLPRVIYLVARSTLWHTRALQFMQAVSRGGWEATLIAPHPGVTTMWLAGIANRLGAVFDAEFNSRTLVERMTIELLPLGIVISLAIVGAYFLLGRLFDRKVAAVAALLLALDPFHIFISKTLHVDALMSVFVMLSALLILVFIGSAGPVQWRYIILSGVFAGLAMLTKTPALFLLPYLLLCLGAWQFSQVFIGDDGRLKLPSERAGWFKSSRRIGGAVIVWIVVLSATYFLLWPSMWTQPGRTLFYSIGQTLFYSDTSHENPLFFLGQKTSEDPGSLFYPVNMAIKTTIITLPFFLVSLFFTFSRKLERQKRLSLLLMLAFILFFTLQMTLGEKKFARYILPALQFVIIMAGFGAVYFFSWLAGGRRWLLNLSLILVVFAQFAIAVPRHPYYGTHYNRLFGSPKQILENGIVDGQWQGEGLDLAAGYLNDLPLSQLLVAGVQNPESFGRYFLGRTVPMIDEEVDYLVFARNWVVRGMEDWNWGTLWENYRERQPKFVVEFDDVPYVWVYKVGPRITDQAIGNRLDADIGGEIRLLGYDLEPSQVAPGQSVQLTLYWEAIDNPSDDYTVFTHLLDPDGNLRGQRDSQPQDGMYPTYLWDNGERIQDQYEITVSPDSPPGEYEMAIGMYELQTLERLPIVAPDGQLLPDRRILITGLEVAAN